MCKFSIGNKVKLNTDTENNTPMTVNNYLKDESRYHDALIMGTLSETDLKTIKCVWRDTNNVPHEEYYHEDALLIIE